MKSIVIVYAGTEMPTVALSHLDNIVRKYAIDNTPIHITTLNDEETAIAVTAKAKVNPTVPEQRPEDVAITYIGEKYLKSCPKNMLAWKIGIDYVNAQKALVKSEDQKALIQAVKLLGGGKAYSANGNLCQKYKYDGDIYAKMRDIYNNLTI